LSTLPAIQKRPTHIPGFDLLANGGLPEGRTTLVCGSAGSGKTVFATQFLIEAVQAGESAVFVTFEETSKEIRRNMLGFDWPIAEYESQGRWAFVDASPLPDHNTISAGSFDFGGLLARVEHAIRKIDASVVAFDSLGAVFTQFSDRDTVRRELYRVACFVRELGVTTIMTAERTEEYGDLARYGIEEFVADNVVILRNVLEDEKRRRTLEILKFRGCSHQKGEYPFSLISGKGIVLIPLSAIELKQHSSNIRVSSGIAEMDRMCGGGFFRDSIILVSGATGTGKTLTATHFISGGAEAGERTLLFAFEESRDQLFRNAHGWGIDFEAMEKKEHLCVACQYPESATLEDHLIWMRDKIEEFRPDRVAVDSLSALERVSTTKSFREFVIAITSMIKHREIIGLFTATSTSLLGGTSTTEAHISTITDSIILLRYVEIYGEMRRGLAVLKMRGSMHDKDIREFSIDGQGMHIGRAFRNISGILSGNFTYANPSEIERLDEMFDNPS
jgi:circadian clock protein KaiC